MNVTHHLPTTADPPHARLLVRCGIAIAPLFLVVAIAQMIARPGFDLARHTVSSLQNGEFGWVQSANFLSCGLLALLCAAGVRQLLRGARGGTWGPLLIGIFGAGMIIAGAFPPDPAFGFPEGAPAGAPEAISTQGALHGLGFFSAFPAVIAGAFVLSRHFGTALPGWRNSSLAAGVTTPLLLILGTVAFPDTSGVFALAAGAISFSWLSAVAWRLAGGLPRHSACPG